MTALVRMAKASGRKLRLSTDLPAHARRLMEIVGLLPFVPIGVEIPGATASARWRIPRRRENRPRIVRPGPLASPATCGRSSVGRASASQAEGRGFETRRPLGGKAGNRAFLVLARSVRVDGQPGRATIFVQPGDFGWIPRPLRGVRVVSADPLADHAGPQPRFVIERVPRPAGLLAAFSERMDAGAKRGRSRRADHQRGRHHDRARREQILAGRGPDHPTRQTSPTSHRSQPGAPQRSSSGSSWTRWSPAHVSPNAIPVRRRPGSAEPGGASSQHRASTHSSFRGRAGLSERPLRRWAPAAGPIAHLASCETRRAVRGRPCFGGATDARSTNPLECHRLWTKALRCPRSRGPGPLAGDRARSVSGSWR